MKQLRRPEGFTWLELLVILAIIGILIGLILPAVERTRSATPLAQCKNNLRQIALATMNYESAHMHFPPAVMGADFGGQANEVNGMAALLPFLDDAQTYGKISGRDSTDAGRLVAWPSPLDRQFEPWKNSNPVFRCPPIAEGSAGFGPVHYAMCIGDRARKISNPKAVRGAFGGELKVTWGDVTDGASNTMLYAEIGSYNRDADCPFAINQSASILDNPTEVLTLLVDENQLSNYRRGVALSDLGRGAVWSDGLSGIALVNTILPPNSPSAAVNGARGVDGIYSASGPHPGGVNVALMDGSVCFISNDIDAGDSSVPTLTEEAMQLHSPSPYGTWGGFGTVSGSEPLPDF